MPLHVMEQPPSFFALAYRVSDACTADVNIQALIAKYGIDIQIVRPEMTKFKRFRDQVNMDFMYIYIYNYHCLIKTILCFIWFDQGEPHIHASNDCFIKLQTVGEISLSGLRIIYKNIPRNQRHCKFCKTLHDEFHFFFDCKVTDNIRPSFIDFMKTQKCTMWICHYHA
jgi:hypothetical protein